ncbi:MAG: efflux RND transporter permease subunit [Candidatus Aminicenantes bacterium]|nr:MAG: efflux RND transporter permease subunit [Candidatus Aminicenantes bacterium]
MKIFVERPVATAMIFMTLLVLGVYSFMNLPLELAPKEEFPELNINTSWQGVPPEVIQTEITAPIEEKVSTVKGIRKIYSESLSGSSRVTLEFDEKTNMEFSHLALREKLSELRDVLPYGVRPNVQPYIPEEFQEDPFLEYTISGSYSLNKLREYVKDRIEIGIGSIKGVADVSVTGGSDPEIKILLDKEKLKTFGISPYTVHGRIQERIEIYPAGRVQKGAQEYIFKVSYPIASTRTLGEIVVIHSGENPIKLKDIAQIFPSYQDAYYINRINGQPTIRMTVYKTPRTSTIKVAKAVMKKLEQVKQELPRDLVFRVVNDESEKIGKGLRELYLLVGIIVAVIFVLVFVVLRSFKPSILVLSSIAFSVLITFNLIYFFKISLNMFTLGGLALGFGLFVDNSIVVFENVLRLREKGVPPIKAAIQGAKEVFLPVLAATLTTMSVFFAFVYFTGRMKIYYLPLAIVITSALAASLLVSFSLIPAMSPRLLKERKEKKVEKVRIFYMKSLKFLLRHPVEVILIIAAIFFGAYKWFRSEVTIGPFFSWQYQQMLYVRVTMPPGTPIEATDEVMMKFEEKVMQKTYEKEMNTIVMAERAYISIEFPPEIEFSYHPYVLKEELIQLATNFAGISIGVSGFDPQGYYSSIGPTTYYDSRIKFYGYNLKKLQEITSNLERTLKRNPRIKDVKITSGRYGWWRLDSYAYVLKIDKEILRRYNVDPQYLYYHLQVLMHGRLSMPLKAKIEGKETDISIKFPEAALIDLKGLQDEIIQTQGGELLRLKDVSVLEEWPIAGSIDREDQQFQQTIMWEFRGPHKAAERYKEAVYNKISLPPGFSATLEGYDWRMTEEELGQIKFAIIFSLIIIFMILASLYESFIQPFFILLAVPLALIGVFVAFVIADFPFDSSAYIGVILLGGIVVNNSILLVDHINLKKKEGLPVLDAVLVGAKERIRPIFMTTSTTVLGMLPLVLIQLEVERRRLWSSLALSAVGGLISSTIFILIVIPIFYYYGDRIRGFASNKIGEFKKAWSSFNT